MTIGEKIKIARSVKGLTQKELGFLVGLPDVRIRQYETDARTPKEGVLRKIADSLGVSIEFFKNHSIEDNTDAMHVMFELRHKLGISVQKAGHDGKAQTYAIICHDSAFNQYLGEWYNQIEKLEQRQSSDEQQSAAAEKDYLLWEARFPQSIADDKSDALRKARKEISNQNSSENI